jgi:hypothetical protein
MYSTTTEDHERQALIEPTDRCLCALVMEDPAAVPLASELRTVEDLQQIKPGEGLWGEATAVPYSFAVYVPDVGQRSVGFIGMMERDDVPVLLGLRLKVRHGEVVEAEHLIAVNLAEANLPNLRAPRPGLLAEIPVGERLPADEIGLKRRADNETRAIPIPPELVRLLRAHIKKYGTTTDGRIFQTVRGGHPAGLRPRSGPRPASRPSPRPSAASRWAAAPTTCGTRRCRCGSTPETDQDPGDEGESDNESAA